MKEKVETLFSDTNVKKYIPFNSAFLLNDYNNDNIAKLEDKFFIMFAKGNGMKKAGINDGDTLFIKRIEKWAKKKRKKMPNKLARKNVKKSAKILASAKIKIILKKN